ncbi:MULTISPECIES: hypothetical protein [unclassified Streptomyces]|uniref:hypothetical protein n=1 Tax=unclassified Streptomyces TaxID=2593676 RepID=UPI0033FE2777
MTLVGLGAAVPLVLVLVKSRIADRSDAQIYGPGLWAALIQVLRLSGEDQQRGERYWLGLSDDLRGDEARIVVRLPLQWLGHEKERAVLALARLLVIDELPTLIRFAYTWWKFGSGDGPHAGTGRL